MLYNLALPLDLQRFSARCDYLKEKHCFVDLSEHKPRRTIPQNNYLHLLLQFLALTMGETTVYVKEEYYKKTCNRDLFLVRKYDRYLKREVERLRSSSELTTEEMSLSIDRLKNWAVMVDGIYLPDAEKPAEIVQAQQEIYKHKEFI